MMGGWTFSYFLRCQVVGIWRNWEDEETAAVVCGLGGLDSR